MSDYAQRRHSGEMGPHHSTAMGFQENPEGLFAAAHDALLEEIHRLSSLLEEEIASRVEDKKKMVHLEAELEETKRELEREKAKGNQLMNKYEMDTMVLQQQVETYQQKMREKKETCCQDRKHCELQQEVEKLQQQISQDRNVYLKKSGENKVIIDDTNKEIKFLQREKRRWQHKFDQMKHSFHEFIAKYESDTTSLSRDAELYREQVKQEKDARLEREKEIQHLINNLRAEKEEGYKKMAGEIIILKKREKYILNELDQVHCFYDELNSRYEIDIIELQQQAEIYQQKAKQGETALLKREKEQKLMEEKQQSALEEIKKLQQQMFQERKAYQEKSEKDKVIQDKLIATNTVLQESKIKEIKFLQERESRAQSESEKIKVLYQELSHRYETDVTALKDEAKRYQMELSCVKEQLEKTKDTLRDHEKQIKVFQEEEEISSKEVGDPLPGCSTDPEPKDETETPDKTVPEDLGNAVSKTIEDGKKNKTKTSIWKKIRNTLGFKKSKKDTKG
ncbi:trichohyalin-like [Poecilia formosa]|uniref:trichohyalin-like n=1 Tax=Poecilia formosa TaxID=48698 RepID=UPI0007B7C4BE|nr:PREDICTED: trichohyalin-like [Poecilia formosa]